MGLRATDSPPACLIKMDAAGELEGAAHEVGLVPETSLPNRWPHNTMLERDIREEKECCRSIHLQSGLPYSSICLATHLRASPCRSTGLLHSAPVKPNGKLSQRKSSRGRDAVSGNWFGTELRLLASALSIRTCSFGLEGRSGVAVP